MNDGFGPGALLASIIWVALLVTIFVAKEQALKGEAVKAGAAEYAITNKETGATEFRWKEIK